MRGIRAIGIKIRTRARGAGLLFRWKVLKQLHRFLFVLGITHILYSCLAVGLAMIKIYSWRKWESQAFAYALDAQAKKNKVMRRQTTFAFHHASHPWSRNRFLIWMLFFLRQFKSSIRKSDYLALRLGFVTVDFIIGGDEPKRVHLEEMREKHFLQDRVEMGLSVPKCSMC